MKLLSFALMIVAGVLAVYGLIQDRKGVDWGRPLATVAAAVALVLALFNLFSGEGSENIKKIRASQEQFQEIAGEKMGQHIATNYEGSKVLAIAGVDHEKMAEEYGMDFGTGRQPWKNYLVGLKKGLGDRAKLVEVVNLEVPQEVKAMMQQEQERLAQTEGTDAMEQIPIDMFMLEGDAMIQAKNYNEILAPYVRKVDVIVMLSEMPYDLENLVLWNMQSPPKLALMRGGALSKLRNAISQDYIVGVVSYRPGYDFEDRAVPKDLEEAFNKRFLLITPDNVEQMASEYEELFPE